MYIVMFCTLTFWLIHSFCCVLLVSRKQRIKGDKNNTVFQHYQILVTLEDNKHSGLTIVAGQFPYRKPYLVSQVLQIYPRTFSRGGIILAPEVLLPGTAIKI